MDYAVWAFQTNLLCVAFYISLLYYITFSDRETAYMEMTEDTAATVPNENVDKEEMKMATTITKTRDVPSEERDSTGNLVS